MERWNRALPIFLVVGIIFGATTPIKACALGAMMMFSYLRAAEELEFRG